MSPQTITARTTTSSVATASRTAATWAWRDASAEGLVASAMPQAGPTARGCY
jgi:hypothetical protein